MMPFNVLAALEQKRGAWTHRAEFELRGTQDAGGQQSTGTGHRQLHRRQSQERYQFNQAISVNAGISNLFNRNYADPLGGSICRDWPAKSGSLQALPGYGARWTWA
jgi:iron complex outermembrane receptor protein